MEEKFFKNDPLKITITVPEFIQAFSEVGIDLKSNGMLEGLVKEDELLDRSRVRTIMFEIMMKTKFSGEKKRYEVNKDGEAREIHEMHDSYHQLHVPQMHEPHYT